MHVDTARSPRRPGDHKQPADTPGIPSQEEIRAYRAPTEYQALNGPGKNRASADPDITALNRLMRRC